MCWFTPNEASKRLLKHHCEEIVKEVKRLEEIGDPIDCSIEDMKNLLDHLYDPNICKEKDENE